MPAQSIPSTLYVQPSLLAVIAVLLHHHLCILYFTFPPTLTLCAFTLSLLQAHHPFIINALKPNLCLALFGITPIIILLLSYLWGSRFSTGSEHVIIYLLEELRRKVNYY